MYIKLIKMGNFFFSGNCLGSLIKVQKVFLFFAKSKGRKKREVFKKIKKNFSEAICYMKNEKIEKKWK